MICPQEDGTDIASKSFKMNEILKQFRIITRLIENESFSKKSVLEILVNPNSEKFKFLKGSKKLNTNGMS